MKLKETNKNLNQIKADEETKEAILDLIDKKISDDMKEVIAEMKGLRGELNASIGGLNSKIDASNSKIDNIKWFIGGAVALAAALAKLFKIF